MATLPLTPDFHAWPVDVVPLRAIVGDSLVEVAWSDGAQSRFHARWLRDGCPCPACLHPDSREPLTDISDLPRSLAATNVSVDAAGVLRVAWSDGHESRYHPGWLRAHDYSGTPMPDPPPVPATWDAGFAARIPTFSARDVLTDDDALDDWLEALEQSGLTRLTGVPLEDEALLGVAARIGVVRETVFGRTFDVRADVRPVSNAYTTERLLPHTDLPTRETQPGIQMLHCLANTVRGGESVMVDGFRLAEMLRDEAPDAFRLLTTQPVEFASRGADSEYRWRSPMIVLDAHGNVDELRPGVLLRAPIRAGFDVMEALYDAIQRFFELTNDARLRVVFPFEPGDLVAFDNRRVLHAREAFEAAGSRHLKGCYLDRDELRSRRRVLARRRVARSFAST